MQYVKFCGKRRVATIRSESIRTMQ